MNDNKIIIVKGNDTNWRDINFLEINFYSEELNLSSCQAIFTLGQIKKYCVLENNSISLNFSAQETSTLPLGDIFGSLYLLDNYGRIATLESKIPFRVISKVHGNAIASEPFKLEFDVKQEGETILNVSVEVGVSVKVGTTTTLPAGENANVINSGTTNQLILDFYIPKGDQGEQGESSIITGATASIDESVGTPSIDVTMGGTDLERTFDFAFHNLKGETGENATITGVTASVTNTVGVPSVDVTTGGTPAQRTFDFVFSNLKGDKGDTGEDGKIIWRIWE